MRRDTAMGYNESNAITRRNIIPALLLTLGLLLPALCPAVGRAQCDVCAGPSRHVTWHVSRLALMQARFGYPPKRCAAGPRCTGYAWMPVPGRGLVRCGIILTSGAELIPTTLRPQNDRFLQNQQMLELVTLPAPAILIRRNSVTTWYRRHGTRSMT